MRDRINISTALVLALACSQFALGQDNTAPVDSQPKLIGSFVYTMPEQVIVAEIDGDVVMAVSVDEKGIPVTTALIAGPILPCGSNPVDELELLSSTLTDAVRRLRFAPAMKDGKPVASETTMTYTLANARLKWPTLEEQVKESEALGYKAPKGVPNGKVSNGVALLLPKPIYPKAARSARESGTVSVKIVIDRKGNVVRSGATRGPLLLQEAAREAACNAKFTPTLLSGIPVRVAGAISYNFHP